MSVKQKLKSTEMTQKRRRYEIRQQIRRKVARQSKEMVTAQEVNKKLHQKVWDMDSMKSSVEWKGFCW